MPEQIENWSDEKLLKALENTPDLGEWPRNQVFAEMLRRIYLKLCDIRVNKGG